MAFSPVDASKEIRSKYYRYLKTMFDIGEPYRKEFNELLQKDNVLAKGPYLDVTDSFEKGKNLEQLIDEGVIAKSFSKINMNMTRPLYKHQEKAIRKVVCDKINLVVSTGTGSGKTESFLIPVLNELAKEAEEGTLSPGVRALIIYPMNALANDQTERLRGLLSDYTEITFGVYTGQTKQEYRDALIDYKMLNGDENPKSNELISRDQMIESPPNILITNYAMLEYLMLRPKDNVFFDGSYANNWKFIVFDEAHVYNGSTGIEVSMLFRRLKARLGNQNIKYILTSATLGDEKENAEVAEFAKNLCNADFNSNDVVRAARITPNPKDKLETLPVSFYVETAKRINNNSPDEIILAHIGANPNEDLSSALYDIISGDKNYWTIRKLLQNPDTVANVANSMHWTQNQLADFVTVASKAVKNDVALFDARYHMFLRAAESAYITLAPDNHIMLSPARYRYNSSTGESFKVFEVAICDYCDAIYLIGVNKDGRLEEYNRMDDAGGREIYLLADSYSDDDDEHSLEEEGIKAEEFLLCPYCGFLHIPGSNHCCEHDKSSFIKVIKAKISNESHTLTKCLACENTNTAGVTRMFFSGQEASTSVIGTALFESLPSYKISFKTEVEEDDMFGFGESSESVAEQEETAKQFIAFSDSRQAAAFYASYLNISYNNILYKRIITETLKSLKQGDMWPLPKFVDNLQTIFERENIHGKSNLASSDDYSMQKEAWKAILMELVDNNAGSSLAKFGLLGIGLNVPKTGKYAHLNLSGEELSDLCSVLGLTMMSDASIAVDAFLNKNDIEDFTYNGVQYSYTLSDSSGKHVKSFIPTRANKTNKRIDYLQKIAAKKEYLLSRDEAAVHLKNIWTGLFEKQKYIIKEAGNKNRLDSSKIIVGKPSQWYYCPKCKKLTCHNIENVCPTYLCDGTLIPVTPEEMFEGNHYYELYNNMEIRDLRVVEHTAQLDKDTASDYQNKFKHKEIDVLSCSTTFEMGVDVGSLETVFMRNMPPHPANYAQRAGRAGRSKQSAAYALTFCNKSSHDFTYFENPVNMIKGRISPPAYKVENDQIGIRHLYAATMGHFWKIHPEYFKSISAFLTKDERGKTGFDIFKEYLRGNPKELREYLESFLPKSLVQEYNVSTFGWIDDLIKDKVDGEDNGGLMTAAINNYLDEVSILEKHREELHAAEKNTYGVTQRLNSYKRENILTFLSRKNILPKYGFPVDTVEMTVSGDNQKLWGLQLQRDLSTAISEYAPGSQIVANDNLITSSYIKRMPSMGWKTFSYIKCEHCDTLNIKPYTGELNNGFDKCSQCGVEFDSAPDKFIIPEYGFIADGSKVKKPGLKRPERTYSGEVSYVGSHAANMENIFTIGNSNIKVITNHNDEMAILNTSPFYVCDTCGYTEVNNKHFMKNLKKSHKNASGYKCSNENLTKVSLGYRFLTDVTRIQFLDNQFESWDVAYSVLQAFLRGICHCLNIKEGDISGCLQTIIDNNGLNWEIVIFDNTPGGSGYAKMMNNEDTLLMVLKYTMSIMNRCSCGGDEKDSSCYACLRSYKNQKYHSILKRKYVIDFLSEIL